jgi:hypothetical protein
MSKKDSLRSTKLQGTRELLRSRFLFPCTFKLLQPPFIHARDVSSREVHTGEEAFPSCSYNITRAQYIARTENTDITEKDESKVILCPTPSRHHDILQLSSTK